MKPMGTAPPPSTTRQRPARVRAALRELGHLAVEPVTVEELHSTALELVAGVVPFDAACLGAVDPATLVLMSGVTVGFRPSDDEAGRFGEIEYSHYEPTSFIALVDSDATVTHLPPDLPAKRHSARYHELTKLIGFRDEIRLTFTTDGDCWAVGDLYRAHGSTGFDRTDLDFLEAASHLIATATRNGIARSSPTTTALAGPAVILADPGGQPLGATPEAEQWQASLTPTARRHLRLATASLTGLVASGAPTATVRLRLDDRWMTLRAAPIHTTSSIAITVETLSTSDTAALFFRAHGLTPRERDVCEHVLAGRSTKQIATAMAISPHTAQDHLKAIFTKTGRRTRGELTAYLTNALPAGL